MPHPLQPGNTTPQPPTQVARSQRTPRPPRPDPQTPKPCAGEEALRRSGLPYTIVRPGGLSDKAAGEAKLRVLQGDTGASGGVARADLAAACVAALADPAAARVTLELVTDKAAAAVAPLKEQLKGLFAGLQPDAAA